MVWFSVKKLTEAPFLGWKNDEYRFLFFVILNEVERDTDSLSF
jgi:hypothetical protein